MCLHDADANARYLLIGTGVTPYQSMLPVLEGQPRSPARPLDRSCYVQDLLDALAPEPARDIAYLCGDPNMVAACFERLNAFGLPITNIRREKDVSPPDPKRLGLRVTGGERRRLPRGNGAGWDHRQVARTLHQDRPVMLQGQSLLDALDPGN